MAKARSAASRYQSSYTDGHVTAAQWVAERLCERKAAQEKRRLARQFWKEPEWEAYFRQQVSAVQRLLKFQGEAAVVAALKRQDVAWCCSAGAKQFRAAVVAEAAKLKAAEAARAREPAAAPPVPAQPAAALPATNTFAGPKNRLRDLD